MIPYIILLICIILILVTYKNNYEHYTDPITPLQELTITILASNITIIKNHNIILSDTTNNLIFYIITPTTSTFYKSDITNYDPTIFNKINDPNNILIIIKTVTNTTPSIQFLQQLKSIGSQAETIRNVDNYILITNKDRTIYYESVTPTAIYYPSTKINSALCKVNPKNILPPKDYILYNQSSYDKIIQCLHEKETQHFGIDNNYCIPLTPNDYNQIKQMPNADNCVDGIGTDTNIMIYDTTKTYTLTNVKNNEYVVFYDLPDSKGNALVIKEGIYDEAEINRSPIKSIYIPENYYLFLIQDFDIIPYYGPLLINIKPHDNYAQRFINVIVQKYKKGNVIVCGTYNNKQICMTYGKGITVLHPKLFIKILYIKMDENIKDVSLFGDISAINLIDNYKNTEPNKYVNVLYPRIIRSIKVN
jgi:hypothetical protein